MEFKHYLDKATLENELSDFKILFAYHFNKIENLEIYSL